MVNNYKGYAYFDKNPNIVKIFDDLESLHDFCRWELLPYDQADLYNKESDVWKRFLQANRNFKGRLNSNRKQKDR